MENIGNIIRRQRKSKNLTQEELGKMLFVSKQSVSKWETGRTLPDIETIRKLCTILDIKSDEILGSSVEEVKHCRHWMKICIFCTALSLLCAAFFGLGGLEYIEHHTQSGIAFLTVYRNGDLLSADDYFIQSNLKHNNAKSAYKFNTEYGEIRGIVRLDNQNEIEYGFINTNNWHNIQIRLEVEQSSDIFSVKQVVSYQTDDNILEVIITENAVATGQRISVFHDGV